MTRPSNAVTAEVAAQMLDHALAAAKIGPVFPITPGQKAPPIHKDWPRVATTDEASVRRMWSDHPNANVGIHTTGLTIVDGDVAKGGAESFKALRQELKLPKTYAVQTPSGGFHAYYGGASRNTVEKLGKGIDTRSDNGYVLAPGSRTAAGEYTIAHDSPIADAPPALIERIGKARERTASTEPVAVATETDVLRAVEYLKTVEPALEGAGGDAHTFAVAARVRDFGLPEADALELMLEHFNPRCQPPWEPEHLQVKVANGYRYAKNQQGSDSTGMFQDLTGGEQPKVEAENPKRAKSEFVLMADIDEREVVSQPWLLRGLIQRGTFVCAYGDPGEGKSVLMLDACHAIAGQRKEWLDTFSVDTNGARVALYVGLEGFGSTKRRTIALRHEYGNAPLALVSGQWDLTTAEGALEFSELVASVINQVGPLAVIVLDTWARLLAAAGADENSATEVGKVIRSLDIVREMTGATIVAIHHSGKDKSAGARGTTALKGAVDTELEIRGGQLCNPKQRDCDEHTPVGFRIVSKMIGMDINGAEVTAPLVRGTPVAGNRRQLTGQAQHALTALSELEGGVAGGVVDYDAWRHAFVSRAWKGDPPTPATVRKAVNRVLDELADLVRRTGVGLQRVVPELPAYVTPAGRPFEEEGQG